MKYLEKKIQGRATFSFFPLGSVCGLSVCLFVWLIAVFCCCWKYLGGITLEEKPVEIAWFVIKF